MKDIVIFGTFLLYISIGIGITAAETAVRNQKLTDQEKIVAVVFWPGIIVGRLYASALRGGAL